MAQFIRGKQAGISSDFSNRIRSDLFVLDDIERFGISSQITQVAYDPVQSLLAVGTRDTKFGSGQLYVFGKGRISASFPLQRQGASVRDIQFASDRVVVLDTKNDIGILSLPDKKWIASYSPPGNVTAIASDHTLDYVIIGLQNGEILAYDIDRENLAPFRVPNLWQEHNPRNRSGPVITLQFHPRDIGKILVGYAEGAVIYSFKQDIPKIFFQYHIPAGAPGGDANPSTIAIPRYPKLTQAVWHPTGTFILTGHEDSSLVIWDCKEGRVIKARTLTDTNVDQASYASRLAGDYTPKTPIMKVVWCANQDPDDTIILVAGGTSASAPTKGMTLMELGRTPNYATSTWPVLSDHFEDPRRQRILPTPPGAEVVNFCLTPRKSPWFAGAQDPIALIAILTSGELITLTFPSGYPISPTNQLHPTLSFVHPFVSRLANFQVERSKWLGMTETRTSGPPILTGGLEAPHPLKRFEGRSIISTAHGDGTVRLWDLGHADQIENETLLQADVARAVGQQANIQITQIGFSGVSSELTVGLQSGEIVIFRWAKNPHPGQEPLAPGPNKPGSLTNITDRRDPSLIEGFHPYTLLSTEDGACTALKVSDVGFIAAGFEGGQLIVIDMRGPAVIFDSNVRETTQKEKSGPFRRKASSTGEKDWATSLEFSVMTVEGDDYSSILLHAGTKAGHLITLKIVPAQGGRFSANVVGSAPLDGQVILIHPLSIASGKPAFATPSAVANLRQGTKVDGTLLVVTKSEARIFKPVSGRAAQRSWDAGLCDCAAVTHCHDDGIALVGLFGDGTARAYSLPGLKEIGVLRLDRILDTKRLSEAFITAAGEVVAWTGPSEVAFLNVWGSGEKDPYATALKLFNPALLIPPRPTISNFQWVSGTQYITPSDLDLLIGGPNRPPSKRMIDQARADEAARRSQVRAGATASASSSDEGYWAYMSRQVQERTERLGLVGDKMDSLEENSSGWADDVNKFVSRQKRNFVLGAVKGKFGI